MYAIPWFVTYLASRVPDRELLLELWDRVVSKDEPTFIYFILVSFVISNQQLIYKADMANLPVVMSNLQITSLQ